MKIVEVKERTKDLIDKLLEVWEDSVKHTHLFLSSDEIKDIKKYVPQALNGIQDLIIMMDDNNNPVAFMGIENNKLEMLFIKNSKRKKGLGKNY